MVQRRGKREEKEKNEKRNCIGSGIDISRKYRSCGSLQCSRFDRKDGRNVWFVEVPVCD